MSSENGLDLDSKYCPDQVRKGVPGMFQTSSRVNVPVGVCFAVSLLLLLMNGFAAAAEVTSEDGEITLIHPFSLQKITVESKASQNIIVLRAASVVRSNRLASNSPALNTLSVGSNNGPVFRNSIVRIPIAHQVRSCMCPCPCPE